MAWQSYHYFLLRFLLTIQHFCSMQSTLVITFPLNVITCLLNFYLNLFHFMFRLASVFTVALYESEYYNLSRKISVKHVELGTSLSNGFLSPSPQMNYERNFFSGLGLIKALFDYFFCFTNYFLFRKTLFYKILMKNTASIIFFQVL